MISFHPAGVTDPGYNYARAKSEVHSGQTFALIGMDFVHIGHSLATGGDPGDGRFILLIARTNIKIANATIAKLIIRVMKLP